MMTAGRELDAAVAITAFGWRWFLRRNRSLIGLMPPDDADHVRWNYRPDEWEEIDDSGMYDRFSDWDRMGGPRWMGKTGLLESLPHYSTDPAACALAKKWLREQGYVVSLRLLRVGVAAKAIKTYNGDEPSILASTEEEAIARLVLAVAKARV